MGFIIQRVGVESSELVFEGVERLLRELGEEGAESGELDRAALARAWREEGSRALALLALTAEGELAGVLTLFEAFAIYAGGRYGIINEMYVVPAHRGVSLGAGLIAAAVWVGRERGWRRIDVTAPESERWSRTRRFYEQQGFVFAGPKLKRMLV
jgi:GNAT superfamily N-acetyltransferase